MNNHTDSYYADSILSFGDYPQLQDNIECDVCIVGAGFSGLSSALHLAEKGFKVVVLENAKIGFGATGRNGGEVLGEERLDRVGAKFRDNSAPQQNLLVHLFRRQLVALGREVLADHGNPQPVASSSPGQE